MLVLISIIFTLLCIFLIFVIVIQPARGEGIASAFGGSGSETFFGTKAGQHINKFTIGLSIVFLLLAIIINALNRSASRSEGSLIRERTPVSVPESERPPAGR
jgi:preprotein translocase subunit SecG